MTGIIVLPTPSSQKLEPGEPWDEANQHVLVCPGNTQHFDYGDRSRDLGPPWQSQAEKPLGCRPHPNFHPLFTGSCDGWTAGKRTAGQRGGHLQVSSGTASVVSLCIICVSLHHLHTVYICVSLHLCQSASVSICISCVNLHQLCQSASSVSVYICVSLHLCQSTSVSVYICVSLHLCHSASVVSLCIICVSLHLCQSASSVSICISCVTLSLNEFCLQWFTLVYLSVTCHSGCVCVIT